MLYVIRLYAFEYKGMEGKTEIPGGAIEIGQSIMEKIRRIIENDGIEITSEIVYGNPAEVIIKTSRDSFDLIVMGSRGLGGLNGVLLGSVSNQVSHYASCPVLLTRLGKEENKIINEIVSAV